MLINRRNAMFGGGGWQNPYVTDGLVAMWDGEWNAGPGVHDANATVWKDLAGANDTAIDQSQVFDDYAFSDGVHRQTLPQVQLGDTFSIEICATSIVKNSDWFHLFSAGNDNNSLGWPARTGIVMQWKYGDPRPTADFTGGTITARATSTTYQLYTGGILRSTTKGGHQQWGNNALQWSNPWNAKRGTAHIHGIRIYSRALTAAEVAANYAVDKARFNLPDA